jgi:hypothetical protein
MIDASAKPTWEELAQLIKWALALFGAPAELAAEVLAPRRSALAIRGWLAALEGMARALLLTMTFSLPGPNVIPGRARRRVRPAPAAPDRGHDPFAEFFVEDPEAEPPPSEGWAGVAFRTLPSSRSTTPGGPRKPALHHLPTRSLALRLEALIRVAEAPEVYARRLARTLARRRLRNSPPLVPRILRWPKGGGRLSEALARFQAHAWAGVGADTG